MKPSFYSHAQEIYAAQGVDTEAALQRLETVPLSLHCWQGDDVAGFENPGTGLTGGGIQATGNYPGKSRTMEELRADLDKVFSLLPGKHRLNLHASYADFGGKKVERDALTPAHFQTWIDWCKKRGLGIDFNSTFFSHPLANEGWTLSSADPKIRKFWIEHGKVCRVIGAEMGRQLGHAHRHQCLDSRWLQGCPHRSQRPARTPARFPRPDLPGKDRSQDSPRRH